MTDERFPNWEINVEKGTIYSLKHKKYIGAIDKLGYVHVGKPKGYKHNFLHQYIWMVANGCDIPEGYDIHHIDGNKLNNSIYNLELVEHKKHLSKHKKGKLHTEESKNKMSKAHKGKFHSEETRRKIGDLHKGFKHSKESKEKMSKANVNNPKLSKQVMQLTLNGELVKIWLSVNECCRNGFDQGNVSRCCNGKLKTYKGFIWRYIEEKGVA